MVAHTLYIINIVILQIPLAFPPIVNERIPNKNIFIDLTIDSAKMC